jgi:hypothetical protein
MTLRVRIDGVPSEEALRRLLADARAQGAEEIVVETTHEAGEGWVRAGFTEVSRVLRVAVGTLELHLGAARGTSFGSIHVQTDDLDAVVHAVRQYVPRLPGRSRGSVVASPRDGWTSVYDELCDREPEMLRRLALELSNRSGALVLTMGVEEGRVVRYIALDRGRVVDEYLSVPEFYGPLPPGEVIALGANPRLMARLTGADAEEIRRAAATAPSPSQLPPAPELLSRLARLFGIQGAEHGYEQGLGIPGAIEVSRPP